MRVLFTTTLVLAACAGVEPKSQGGVRVAEQPIISAQTVAEAQRLLEQRGLYVGPISGELSPATRVALVYLQRDARLPVTGIVDGPTAAFLGIEIVKIQRSTDLQRSESARKPTGEGEPGPSDGVRKPQVRVLEQALSAAREMLDDGAEKGMDLLWKARKSLSAGDSNMAWQQMNEACGIISASREAAFESVRLARSQGGFPELPSPLQKRFEAALLRESLIVELNETMGEDDLAAIRWIERSQGAHVTGKPSLRVLDELGVDSATMLLR